MHLRLRSLLRNYKMVSLAVVTAASAVMPAASAHSTECINDVQVYTTTSTQVCSFACDSNREVRVYARGWNFKVTASCGGASASCSVTDKLNFNEECLVGGGTTFYHDDFGTCKIEGLPVGQKNSVHCVA